MTCHDDGIDSNAAELLRPMAGETAEDTAQTPTLEASPLDIPPAAPVLLTMMSPLEKQSARSVSSTIRSVSQQRPQRLYSRSADQERLVQLYRKSIAVATAVEDDDNPSNSKSMSNTATTDLVIISGVSGVGKTTLALSLEPHVLADQGFFVKAKCSNDDDNDPLAPYKSILEDLMKQLFNRAATSFAPNTNQPIENHPHQKWQSTLCSQIRKAAGEEMHLLERVVPTMKQVRALLRRMDRQQQRSLSLSHRRLRSNSRLSWKEDTTGPQHQFPINNIVNTTSSFPSPPNSQIIRAEPFSADDPDEEATATAAAVAVGTNTLSVRRFEYAFQKVLRAVASPKHPVVILMDDVQNWAKTTTSTTTTHTHPLEEQLYELASNKSGTMGGLFFIMTYRIEQPPMTKNGIPIIKHDVQLQQRLDRSLPNTIQQHHWALSGLAPQAIHELLVDTLSLEGNHRDQKLDDISNTVYQVTQGNVLFVLEILRAFQEDELLLRLDGDKSQQQQRQDPQWVFVDHLLLQQHPILQVQTLQDLYRAKILDLAEDVQDVLKVSACLGVHFLWHAAKKVVGALYSKKIVFSTAWGVCEQAHLVCLHNHSSNTTDDEATETTTCHASFAHDSIHQAAYQLIPPNEREAWHLKIGRTLWQKAKTREELESFLFVILEQIFLGESLIVELEDRIAVASLCLHAGETAVKTSGFELSATYLQKGIDLLGPTKWRKNNTYDLCLALFNNAIDTCYATGQMDRVELLIQEVLENARVFEDELRARVMLIYTLGTKQDMSTAIERGVETLHRLGEHIEQAPSKFSVQLAMAKTRRLLRRNSDTRLMRLAAMTDQRLISVQIVLNVMWLSAYYNNAALAAMISCRMVELSVRHGASVVSCVGFAMFATMILGGGTHLEEARRYALIAFDLAKRFGGETWLCRISTQLYGMVNIWVKPMPYCLERLKHAYQVGLGGGDMEYAMLNASLYIWNNVDRLPIDEIEARARSLTERMNFLGQEKGAYMLRPVWQMSLNFLGQAAGDPTQLTGEVLKDEDIETLLREAGRGRTMHSNASLYKMMLAYHFSDFETAATYTKQARLVYQTFGTLGAALARLYDCLALLEMLKQRPRWGQRWSHEMRVVQNHLKMFRYWANRCPENNMGKLCLVEAEVARVLNQPMEAQAKYYCAILLARDGGILMEHALANERAGKYQLELGNLPKAKELLKEAYRLYREWGGLAKVDHLSAEVGHLVDLE